jgi:23S rRNA pseudouridine1911/1915/1917 synthase
MIPIVYQDDEVLVLEKPPGLITTISETSSNESLQDILSSDFNIKIERSGIVHRLDKDTSGLIVAAKTNLSLEKLQNQFKERIVKKEYIALVHGLIEKEGNIKAAIVRHPGNREKFTVVDQLKFGSDDLNAREAETRYAPVGNLQISSSSFQKIFEDLNKIQTRKLERTDYNKFTLVRCFPLTGRTHQIRVHLKYLGFPIVGDEKYGGRKTVRLDKRWCPRQFLHAAHLEFDHPETGERMIFESELPDDLKVALGNLEKIN